MNLPTKITFSRIIATVAMLIALFVLYIVNRINGFQTIELGNTGINLIFLILFVFFLIASYTDHLDGSIARKRNMITDLGKFLDPVADKLLINSMVIFLIAPSLFARYIPNSETVVTFNMWCAIILVARDIVVDALRFIAAQKKVVIAANIFGKAKTVLEMVAISAVLLNDFPFNYFDKGWVPGLRFSDILVYLATAVSLISGVIYVVQNKQVFIEKKQDSAE